jgi:hypothetical protein
MQRTAPSRLVLPSVGPIDRFAVTAKCHLVALAGVVGPVSIWDAKNYGFYYRALVDEVALGLTWSSRGSRSGAGSLLAILTLTGVKVAVARKAGETVWPAAEVARFDARGNALTLSPGDDFLVVDTDRGCASCHSTAGR